MVDYHKSAEECNNYFSRMCKNRTKELRNCVLPRCCGICPQIDYCEGVCKPLIEEYPYLKDNSEF